MTCAGRGVTDRSAITRAADCAIVLLAATKAKRLANIGRLSGFHKTLWHLPHILGRRSKEEEEGEGGEEK